MFVNKSQIKVDLVCLTAVHCTRYDSSQTEPITASTAVVEQFDQKN